MCRKTGRWKKEIPLEEVVVGDIVHLAAGDMIPADMRIIEAKDLFISQSALTGESEPLEKIPEVSKEKRKLLLSIIIWHLWEVMLSVGQLLE